VNSHRFVRAAWWPALSWALIWPEHPDVKVRIGDEIFALTAVVVEDAAEREKVLRHRGYDDPLPPIVVFRFEPRAVQPTAAGARSRARTCTASRPGDFKSPASASFAIRARRQA
jgi:hypothetical protein